jgi:hypothetical protein
MNVTPSARLVAYAAFTLATVASIPSLADAQVGRAGQGRGSAAADSATPVARLVAEPARISVRVGDSAAFKVVAYDAAGRVIPNATVRVTGPRRTVAVLQDTTTPSLADGFIRAFSAGDYVVTANATGRGNTPIELSIPVAAAWPALTRLEVTAAPGNLYAGLTIAHSAKGFHQDGTERKPTVATWRSSDASVASVDRFGNVTAVKTGAVTITAEVDGVRSTKAYTIAPNPVARIDIQIPDQAIRTGDVVHLKARALRADGSPVADAPITWSYTYVPDDTIQAPGGPGIIDGGLFAGNYGGRYTILAYSGAASARTTLEVKPRDVRQRITVTGRGNVNKTHTSDLWPWTGKDGRDYALVGTWGGDGWALVFDITDLNNIKKTDSVQVNARTINDVTVSPDGRYGVLSREGASDRINGVVILDLANPAHPKIASTFSQELTGGVHNMFATNDHLFAISGGQKYVIIDVKDIYKPKYVSEYRHPNARIHDLWVHDGIAYSAQGGVGTVVVDVGNGKYGGTIENGRRRDEPCGPRVGRHFIQCGTARSEWTGARRRGANVGWLYAHLRLHRSDESEEGRTLSPRGLRLARHHRAGRHSLSGVL